MKYGASFAIPTVLARRRRKVTAGRSERAQPDDSLPSRAFQHEIGESAHDTELRVGRGLAAGQLWLWERSGEAVSMAIGREPVDGVVRLSGVGKVSARSIRMKGDNSNEEPVRCRARESSEAAH